MVKICNGLLEYTPAEAAEVDSAIRVGDVFALLIEYHQSVKQYDAAYTLIEKMNARKIILSPYLDQEMLNTIYRAVGKPIVNQRMRGADDDDGIDEDIDEPVDD
eukprot:1187569-Prorocentrum_minimum.AAC.2